MSTRLALSKWTEDRSFQRLLLKNEQKNQTGFQYKPHMFVFVPAMVGRRRHRTCRMLSDKEFLRSYSLWHFI